MILLRQLVKKGLLEREKEATLEYEIKNSKKKEEEVILEKRIVDENVLFRLKSEVLNIPLKDVVPESISLKVLELIPEESAKYYQMIPLGKEGNVLDVGMIYPEDLKTQEALKFLARQEEFEYKVFLITFTTFNNILKQYRNLRGEVKRALAELETEIKKESVKPSISSRLERLTAEAPISKVVAVILRQAVEGGASDIHIEPTKQKLRVRFRLDGVLHSSIFLPKKVHPSVVARIKILSNLRIDETRIPQDGRFSTKIDNKDIDFRVSTFPTTLGEKVVIRVLDPSKGLKTFNELGLSGQSFNIVKEAIKSPYGMILSAGPTGSGKTTTLYAILRDLNKEGVNIMTLEDPVEYFIEGVNQSQIKPEIGYTFANGLRHMLRQDPDIIMVGEIRDEETANLATHAALTGHLVLSTVHTSNVLGVIPRLIDLGVQPFLLSPTLNCAMSQRLVRRLCPFCKKKIKPNEEVEKLIRKEIDSFPQNIRKNYKIPDPLMVWQADGCKKCGYTGYYGRVAIFEVLSMTKELGEIVLKKPSEMQIEQEARRQGLITMRQDGILKVLNGTTSIEEVLRVTEEDE